MNKIDLKDKVAIVTGGVQGFGLAVVERFLNSGANVVIWENDKKLLDKFQTISNVHKIQTDVSNAESVEAAVNETINNCGRIDILVNNAGIAGPNHKTWEYPNEDWQKVIDIDLTGVFYCCKYVVPQMIKNNYGRIVNIASVSGKDGNANASAYSSSKAGVIGLTKSLGKELALNNIAVNAVTPAGANTRILNQMSKEHVQRMLSKVPKGRFLEVHELTSMVCWLSSEENSFSTAAVFDISGGRSTY